MSDLIEEQIEPRNLEDPILNVDNIIGGYGSIEIVHGISLQLGEQEITTIIGPNGCGKSTFLKLVFGLASRHEGSIHFAGEDFSYLRTDEMVQKGISYVPQVDNVFPDLTILENLEMGSYLIEDDIQDDLDRVFSIFPELMERKYDLASNLSGGQRQMLALSRALMTRPKLMLLDEPTAALSPIFVQEILKKIVDLREEGMSIILVEQNARSALKYSDYCYVFANGNTVMHYKADDILKNRNIGELFLGIKREYTKQ